jgi:uncharacterized protein
MPRKGKRGSGKRSGGLGLPWWVTIGSVERLAQQKHLPDAGASRIPESADPLIKLLVFKGFNTREQFALYRAAPTPLAPTIVFFHGLGQQLAGKTTRLVETFGQLGLGCLACEYTSYGLAHKYAPSEAALYEDVEIILKETKIKGPMILLGYSMGTGVATEMAKRGYGTRLILIAPYTSVPDMVSTKLPIIIHPLSDWLVDDRFDTAQKAPNIKQKTLIIHGTDDTVIPFQMGERLSRLFPNNVFVPIKGASHFLFNPPTDKIIIGLITRFAQS